MGRVGGKVGRVGGGVGRVEGGEGGGVEWERTLARSSFPTENGNNQLADSYGGKQLFLFYFNRSSFLQNNSVIEKYFSSIVATVSSFHSYNSVKN